MKAINIKNIDLSTNKSFEEKKLENANLLLKKNGLPSIEFSDKILVRKQLRKII
jgi:hypothetical protein